VGLSQLPRQKETRHNGQEIKQTQNNQPQKIQMLINVDFSQSHQLVVTDMNELPSFPQ